MSLVCFFVKYCTLYFVSFGTIILKSSNHYTAAVTVQPPSKISGSLQYARYSAYVPVMRDPLFNLFQHCRSRYWSRAKPSVYASIMRGAHVRRLAGLRHVSACCSTVTNGVLFQSNICPLRASYADLVLSIRDVCIMLSVALICGMN